VPSWEAAVSRQFRALHLDSIRNKLLVFAVLATLIPSLSTAWVSYAQNRRSLGEKITGELQSLSSATAREMDLWVKEHLYELHVFASSYEVSDNLARPTGTAQGLRRLHDYLHEVQERFSDYEELVVLDRHGTVVATSSSATHSVTLPGTWTSEFRTNNGALGTPAWDHDLRRMVMMAGVPIRLPNGPVVGTLVGRLNFRSVDEFLKHATSLPGSEVFLLSDSGSTITSSLRGSSDSSTDRLPPATLATLVQREPATVDYHGLLGVTVVGSLKEVPRVDWATVAEVPADEAYRQIIQLRNETALIMLVLVVVVGCIGYVLSQLIVRPVDRLTRAAGAVAAGDLAVDLPVTTGGEVGYLTEVFNHMVARLRENRAALDATNETLRAKNEELERLSITDSLTKLFNRRYLLERLSREIDRSRRHKRTFAVLLVDVDNFKRYNDAYGHLAGDEVLMRVAALLQESTRQVDCVARYGGEEFIAVLAETDMAGAAEACERIRTRLATQMFHGAKITLSIGVAEFPTHGETPEALTGAADAAMYEAKGAGRDQVKPASAPPRKGGRQRA
jgi:diguanylate cyclase (GGDEF)-like protein